MNGAYVNLVMTKCFTMFTTLKLAPAPRVSIGYSLNHPQNCWNEIYRNKLAKGAKNYVNYISGSIPLTRSGTPTEEPEAGEY